MAVSAVSNMTGFAHDLPALSNLVHRHGALLYADIIQLAGAAPFDMAGSGVDACAGSGFKWLMGDIGLGFLSVRPELRSALLRPIHGYRQLVEDIEPWPPTGTRDWVVANDAAGLFEAASLPVGVASSLAASTGLLHEIGIDKIVAHRGPLLARIAAALPPLGYRRITPEGSIAPFLVFDKSSRPGTSDLLQAAGIDVGLMGDVMRISVSIFNTEDHVDRLIAALSG